MADQPERRPVSHAVNRAAIRTGDRVLVQPLTSDAKWGRVMGSTPGGNLSVLLEGAAALSGTLAFGFSAVLDHEPAASPAASMPAADAKTPDELPLWLDTGGGCHIFARAAARLTGWDMRVIMRTDEDDEDNAENGLFHGYTNLSHVYLLDPDGNRFDANGRNEDVEGWRNEHARALGWEVDDVSITTDEIDELVAEGWLLPYTLADLAAAETDVLDLLLSEGYDPKTFSPAPPEAEAAPAALQRILAYHGNKRQVVTQFEKRPGTRAAWFDTKEVEAQGFFFITDIDDAASFGPHVGCYELQVAKPLIQGEAFNAAHLAEVLLPLFSERDGDHLIFRGMEHDYWVAADPQARDPEWVHQLLHTRSTDGALGIDWEVLDNPACVERMRALGYDSVMAYEPHTKTMLSWFVLDATQVTYIGIARSPDLEDQDECGCDLDI